MGVFQSSADKTLMHISQDKRQQAHEQTFLSLNNIYSNVPWLLCLGCVYLGVLSATLLPASLLWGLSSVVSSPIAAIPLAIVVFDRRAWRRWQAARGVPIGLRMLRAYSDGVLWLRWWPSRGRS